MGTLPWFGKKNRLREEIHLHFPVTIMLPPLESEIYNKNIIISTKKDTKKMAEGTVHFVMWLMLAATSPDFVPALIAVLVTLCVSPLHPAEPPSTGMDGKGMPLSPRTPGFWWLHGSQSWCIFPKRVIEAVFHLFSNFCQVVPRLSAYHIHNYWPMKIAVSLNRSAGLLLTIIFLLSLQRTYTNRLSTCDLLSSFPFALKERDFRTCQPLVCQCWGKTIMNH